MNRSVLKGHWNEFKGMIKQQWAKLTSDIEKHREGKKRSGKERKDESSEKNKNSHKKEAKD